MNDVYQNIEAWIPHLKRYALSITRDSTEADDLVQDSIERALSRSCQYRSGTNLRAWLFAILHNLHVSNLRRPSHNAVHIDIDIASRSLPSRQPDQEQEVHLQVLSNALRQLPGHQVALIERVALGGESYEEIADSEGIAVGTVKSRVSRGRRALRRALDGVDPLA
ncbi:MAG: sigma-70 family RNA polymerase sigma factor [Gammaproteobacteria bacterium]|nr:sigma-70 family RNA polymerase sigma factor [Gammaproteobacteria bacterium]